MIAILYLLCSKVYKPNTISRLCNALVVLVTTHALKLGDPGSFLDRASLVRIPRIPYQLGNSLLGNPLTNECETR